MRVIVLSFAAVFLAACDFLEAPTDVPTNPDDVTVSSLLVEGADTAKVLLTAAGEGDMIFEFTVPVPGADVRLIRAGDTIHLANTSAGSGCLDERTRSPSTEELRPGCYMGLVPGGVRSGDEFRLLIRTPAGRTISGNTRVPAPLVVTQPVAGQEITFGDTDTSATHVAWSAPDAGTTQISAGSSAGPCVFLLSPTAQASFGSLQLYFRDSASADVYFRASSCSATAGQRFDATVVVTRFDSAYTGFMDNLTGETVLSPDAAVGITGAFGVFASAAQASVPVVLVKQ